MVRRKRVWIGAVFIGLLAFLVWTVFGTPSLEPDFQGRLLSDWLIQLEDSPNKAQREKAALAVQHIGTNATPTLLRMLQEDESPFKTKFQAWNRGWYNPFELHIQIFGGGPANTFKRAEAGFEQLGPLAASAVPELSSILDQYPSRNGTSYVPSILGNIGPDAKAAVPSLLRAAVRTNSVEHYYVFRALGQIHTFPNEVVPVLMNVISNTPTDRMYAVAALGQFGSAAKSAVPTLAALLNDPKLPPTSPRGSSFLSDRDQVERALKRIDPVTYDVVVSNKTINPSAR
jgi:hypothetical protein